VAQAFLLRELVDNGPEAEPRYINKFTKVVGELDELRVEYCPLLLNKGKKDAEGRSLEVIVLMKRRGIEWLPYADGSFHSGLNTEPCPTCGARVYVGYERWHNVGDKATRTADGQLHRHIDESTGEILD
jgi:hypothetical protein